MSRLDHSRDESGAVNERELAKTSDWLSSVINGYVGFPFSFTLDGKEFVPGEPRWSVRQGDVRQGDGSSVLPNGRGKTDEPSPCLTDREFFCVSFTDAESGLEITWQGYRYADFPAVEWTFALENTGQTDTGVIGEFKYLDLSVDNPSGEPCVIHGANGGRCGRDDLMPFSWQVPFTQDAGTRAARLATSRTLGGVGVTLRSSEIHLPFINLQMPDKCGLCIGVGWSGTWEGAVSNADNTIGAAFWINGAAFYLKPGERIQMPKVLLMFWEGEPLHGSNMLRRLLYKHYIPNLSGQPQKPLVSVNSAFCNAGEGWDHDISHEKLAPLIEPFASLGAELFIMDYGWNNDRDPDPMKVLGDWTSKAERFPDGLKPFSDALNKNNITFGLWFQCEKVMPQTPVARTHPEWMGDHRENPERMTLRFCFPQAREWFLGEIKRLVCEQGMGCYRQDGWGDIQPDEQDGRKGITQFEHLNGLYAMWDALREQHPDLIYEGCSGGGRRIDLQALGRFHWHQKSDRWYDSESDQCSLYGANLFLPGGALNIPINTTSDYAAFSGFAGQLSLGWDVLDPGFDAEQAAIQVLRYKRLRHLLSGDFYPMTPCTLDGRWLAYQFHRADLDEGMVIIFKRQPCSAILHTEPQEFVAVLRGLSPDIIYSLDYVTSGKSETVSANELADGIPVTLEGAPSSEIVYYKKQ